MGAIATLLTNLTKTEKRSSTTSPAQWLVDWVSGGSETASGATVDESSALKYTPFWAAVRIISGTLAALPFKVYQREKGGGKRPAQEHPIYRLLHGNPNPYMDAVTFFETRQAHVLTYGNGYAEIQRDGSGRPIALWPLLPDKTERKISEAGVPYYQVRLSTPSGGQQTVILRDEDVLHIKGLGFDGYTGYDVVSYHKETIGYGMAVKEYGARFFGNGASPGGHLEHPNVISDTSKRHLEEFWNKSHQGLSNAHRIAILEEGMKWHETGVDPQKAQALEVQKWTVDDCARIFQIPPHKIQSMEWSKYANVYDLNSDFYCSTMLYWFRKWESELNYKLFMPSEQGAMFCEILVDALLRGNITERTAFYQAGRQWGFLSINDIREKENMNGIGEAGDIYLDPLNMKPAGTPNPEPAKPAPEPDDEPDDAVRNAQRKLFSAHWVRILRKQANANSQKSTNFWWTEHRGWAGEVLFDSCVAYAAIVGKSADEASGVMHRLLMNRLNPETSLTEADADKLADELIREIGGSHADG